MIASQARAVRGQGLPYTYALSSDTPPLLYFRLPSAEQMQRVGGRRVSARGRQFSRANSRFGVAGGAGRDGRSARLSGRRREAAQALRREAAAALRVARGRGGGRQRLRHRQELRVGKAPVRPDHGARRHRARSRQARASRASFTASRSRPNEGLPVAFSKERYGQRYVRRTTAISRRVRRWAIAKA